MSERQLQANRANGTRSKGRKSQEGIQRSAQNARKHGLRAADIRQNDPACRLSQGEASEFAAFAEELLRDLAPENARQLTLARRIVAGFWALRRLLAFERDAVHKARVAATPERRAAIVLPEGEDFERLMLYESRMTGRLDRAIKQFLLERFPLICSGRPPVATETCRRQVIEFPRPPQGAAATIERKPLRTAASCTDTPIRDHPAPVASLNKCAHSDTVMPPNLRVFRTAGSCVNGMVGRTQGCAPEELNRAQDCCHRWRWNRSRSRRRGA